VTWQDGSISITLPIIQFRQAADGQASVTISDDAQLVIMQYFKVDAETAKTVAQFCPEQQHFALCRGKQARRNESSGGSAASLVCWMRVDYSLPGSKDQVSSNSTMNSCVSWAQPGNPLMHAHLTFTNYWIKGYFLYLNHNHKLQYGFSTHTAPLQSSTRLGPF
jgi:hypothetical protein